MIKPGFTRIDAVGMNSVAELKEAGNKHEAATFHRGAG
jgi:hypothetical protein